MVLALALVVLGVAAFALLRPRGGAATPEEAGVAYVAALEAGDRDAIARLTPPDFDAESAIEDKLSRARAFRGERPVASYAPHGVSPNIVVLSVTVPAAGYEDRVLIQRFGDRWYLAIGARRDGGAGPPTAQPR